MKDNSFKEDSKMLFSEAGDGKEMHVKFSICSDSHRVVDCELGEHFTQKLGKTDSILLKDLINNALEKLLTKLLTKSKKQEAGFFDKNASLLFNGSSASEGDNISDILKLYKSNGFDVDSIVKSMGFNSMSDAIDSIKDSVEKLRGTTNKNSCEENEDNDN